MNREQEHHAKTTPVRDWRAYLTETRERNVQSILEHARRIAEFREHCKTRQGGSTFASDMFEWLGASEAAASQWLSIGKAYAELISIAKDLPSDWYSIYLLSRLTAKQRAYIPITPQLRRLALEQYTVQLRVFGSIERRLSRGLHHTEAERARAKGELDVPKVNLSPVDINWEGRPAEDSVEMTQETAMWAIGIQTQGDVGTWTYVSPETLEVIFADLIRRYDPEQNPEHLQRHDRLIEAKHLLLPPASDAERARAKRELVPILQRKREAQARLEREAARLEKEATESAPVRAEQFRKKRLSQYPAMRAAQSRKGRKARRAAPLLPQAVNAVERPA